MFGFLRIFWNGFFKTRRHGYTLRGFWGEKKHYNKDGIQTGYSVKGFWGGWKRYDMDGNLISYTLRNFWGGYDTYDADGNLKRKSRRNFWGGFHTYTPNGEKVIESYRSFWGGVDHYEVDQPAQNTGVADETSTATVRTQKEVAQHTTQVHATQSSQVTPLPSATRDAIPQTSDRELIPQEPAICIEKFEETHLHESSEDYNDLLREIDNTGAGKYELKESSRETNSVNLLVFSYGEHKGFPARAYVNADSIEIEPLIKGERMFTFHKGEIARANRRMVDNLDMMDIEDEFSALNGSALLPEFEELFPEYEYGTNGVTRAQYELECGLIITENSWLKLCEKKYNQ